MIQTNTLEGLIKQFELATYRCLLNQKPHSKDRDLKSEQNDRFPPPDNARRALLTDFDSCLQTFYEENWSM